MPFGLARSLFWFVWVSFWQAVSRFLSVFLAVRSSQTKKKIIPYGFQTPYSLCTGLHRFGTLITSLIIVPLHNQFILVEKIWMQFRWITSNKRIISPSSVLHNLIMHCFRFEVNAFIPRLTISGLISSVVWILSSQHLLSESTNTSKSSLSSDRNTSLHRNGADPKGFGTFPTSILQRKIGICTYKCTACRNYELSHFCFWNFQSHLAIVLKQFLFDCQLISWFYKLLITDFFVLFKKSPLI